MSKTVIYTLTQAELKATVTYNPETGAFTRVPSRYTQWKARVCKTRDKDNYIIMKVYGTMYRSHRLAFLYMTGKFPVDQVDHRNGIEDDNRWENLREADNHIQQHNRKKGVKNTSGYIGVHLNRKSNKYHATMRVDGNKIFLGGFDKIEDAVAARKKADVKYGYSKNHGKGYSRTAKEKKTLELMEFLT